MRHLVLLLALATAFAQVPSRVQTGYDSIQAARLKANLTFLASGALEGRRAHDLTIRVTWRDELGLMLRLAGFEVEAVYGGFEGEAFTAESDHLIVLARRG